MTQSARSRSTLFFIFAIALSLLPVSTQAQSSTHPSAHPSIQRSTEPSTEPSFETQPTGTYRYTAAEPVSGSLWSDELLEEQQDHTGYHSSHRSGRTWILRKSGSAVIGIELSGDRTPNRPQDRTPNRTPNIEPDRPRVLHCLRGQAAGDRIIRITQVSPPYTPAANWESQQTLDLAPLTRQSPSPITTPAEQAALVECIQAFWR
ncbi:MAG: hypothetical protein WBG63_16385 [Phormidesmis sp.]